jgi:hypothetical protein
VVELISSNKLRWPVVGLEELRLKALGAPRLCPKLWATHMCLTLESIVGKFRRKAVTLSSPSHGYNNHESEGHTATRHGEA